MSEYIKREAILSIVSDIRPVESDYFNIGIAEEKVLDAKQEIANELEKLPYTEFDDMQIFVALTKQTKKKPHGVTYDCGFLEYWNCPNCGIQHSNDYKAYCDVCGQAIDWEGA